jgi:hypothetical protein
VQDLRELRLARGEPVVAAGLRARANVADVRDELEPLAVQVVDQRVEAPCLVLRVGRVAHHPERNRAVGERRKGSAASAR